MSSSGGRHTRSSAGTSAHTWNSWSAAGPMTARRNRGVFGLRHGIALRSGQRHLRDAARRGARAIASDVFAQGCRQTAASTAASAVGVAPFTADPCRRPSAHRLTQRPRTCHRRPSCRRARTHRSRPRRAADGTFAASASRGRRAPSSRTRALDDRTWSPSTTTRALTAARGSQRSPAARARRLYAAATVRSAARQTATRAAPSTLIWLSALRTSSRRHGRTSQSPSRPRQCRRGHTRPRSRTGLSEPG
jgi:hypothetical protein